MVIRSANIASIVCLLSVVAFSGCWSPSFGFRKAEAYGVVIDQDGYPLTNAMIRASWLPGCIVPFIRDAQSQYVSIRPDGSWRFSKRNIENLTIDAYAPTGYEPWLLYQGLYPGHCASNVVFQFHKKKVPKETE